MAINSLRRNPGLVCCPGPHAYNLFFRKRISITIFSSWTLDNRAPFSVWFLLYTRYTIELRLLTASWKRKYSKSKQTSRDRLEQRVYIIFSSTSISQINVMTIKEIQKYTSFRYHHFACMILQQIVIIKYEKTAFHSTHI